MIHFNDIDNGKMNLLKDSILNNKKLAYGVQMMIL